MIIVLHKEPSLKKETTRIGKTKTEETLKEEKPAEVDVEEFLRFRRLLQQRKGRRS